MQLVELLPVILTGYALIALILIKHFLTGMQRTKARLTCRTRYGAPRFTAREPNGRFKANKVGFFYIASQGI